MVRFLQANTHFVVHLDGIEELEAIVESDPEPIIVHVVDDANLKLLEAGEEYEFFGDDDAALFHDLNQELDEGNWHLVITNEQNTPTAVNVDILDEDEDGDDEEEEEEGEDEDEDEDDDTADEAPVKDKDA
jgi:hypothetical protein